MNETEGTPPVTRSAVKLFRAVTPSKEDLRQAAKIPADQCPRRYCWWWRSLSFDWNLSPSHGCTFLVSAKPPGTKNPDSPCCRCDHTSVVDHYEPRDPHLMEDGFEVTRWDSPQPSRPDGEISYDLVMECDMTFSEGCYRIGESPWSVVIISKRPIEALSWSTSTWESGVSGIVMYVPNDTQLNTATIERLLSEILGVEKWKRVRGPDSMHLR